MPEWFTLPPGMVPSESVLVGFAEGMPLMSGCGDGLLSNVTEPHHMFVVMAVTLILPGVDYLDLRLSVW